VTRPRPGGIRALRSAAAVAAAAALACAGAAHTRYDAERPPEVLVEVLPRAAEVELDGRKLGKGSRAVPAPPGSGEHVLRVRAEGFEPVERTIPPQSLAGARLAAALRPRGFGAARLLDLDDPEGLALAGAHLVRAGDGRDAVDYAERASSLDPALPLPWRVLGDARAALGDPRRAGDAWARYVFLAPDAPDAPRVMRDLDRVRGGTTIELHR